MAGKTPRQAFEAFSYPIQQALALVVPSGRGVLTYFPQPLQVEAVHWLSLPQGRPVRLAGAGLLLKFIIDFRIRGVEARRDVYDVVTTAYRFGVRDQQRHELLACHFHQSGESWCMYPHLHVAGTGDLFSGKAHLATGWVSLPAVIRMLLEDPAIPVVSLRPDWPRVLDDAQAQSDS